MKRKPRVRYDIIFVVLGLFLIFLSTVSILVLKIVTQENLAFLLGGIGLSIVGLMIPRPEEPPEQVAGENVHEAAPPDPPPAPPPPKPENTPDPDTIADARTFDYARHFYIVGATGQGKSSLMAYLALTLFQMGNGGCIIDAKGDLAKAVARTIPANREQDTIYLDLRNPIPLNLFAETDDDDPEALIGEIKYLITRGENVDHAPLMQAVLDDLIHILLDFNENVPPHHRATLLDIQFFLEDEPRRQLILSRIKNERLRRKWKNNFPNQRTVASIIARLTPIVNSPSLSKVFGCPNPKLTIREVMDTKKILLVDLGGVSEPKQILGTLLVAKIRQAAFRRASIEAHERVPFYLFVDEFQYFQTSDFAHILSVARGYGLHLLMANQFMGQLSKEIRASILGNVGNYFIFALGYGDAQYFAHLFPKPEPPMTLKEKIADRQRKFMETGNNLYMAEAEILKLKSQFGGEPPEPKPPDADILYHLSPYKPFFRDSHGELAFTTLPPPRRQRDASFSQNIINRTIRTYSCDTPAPWSTTEPDDKQSPKPDDISAGELPNVPPHGGKKKNP